MVSITDSVDMNLNKLQEIVKDGEAWRAAVQRVRHSLVTEQQQQLIFSFKINHLSLVLISLLCFLEDLFNFISQLDYQCFSF